MIMLSDTGYKFTSQLIEIDSYDNDSMVQQAFQYYLPVRVSFCLFPPLLQIQIDYKNRK